MATSGNAPPPKPWERVGSSSGPSPFRPSSSGPTSNVVESSGVAKPGETKSNTGRNVPSVNRNIVNRPMQARPWEQNYGGNYGSNYGGYGTLSNYNSGYGSGLYGSNSNFGGFGYGGPYGSSIYGNNMYRGYGGYGAGGMYNTGVGGTMGGYGMGGMPYDSMNGGGPNDPFGGPPTAPSFWQSMLRVMHGVVSFLGRIAMLVDQNTQAFHFFITALLQLFDRTGVLYGELARFVLRFLGIRTKPRSGFRNQSNAIAGEGNDNGYYVEEPKEPVGAWDNVWGDEGARQQ